MSGIRPVSLRQFRHTEGLRLFRFLTTCLIPYFNQPGHVSIIDAMGIALSTQTFHFVLSQNSIHKTQHGPT